MSKELEFLKEHCVFSKPHEVYVLLAVSRKKDTVWITNSQEIVFRETIKTEEDIAKKFKRIRLMCENYHDDEGRSYPFYIYITNNSRCSFKAAKSLAGMIIDSMYEEARGVDMSSTFKKLDYKFISALMKKTAKGSTRRFMIDVDTKDLDFNAKIRVALFDNRTTPIATIETRNGYHYKTVPFNVKKFNDYFTPEELKTLVNVKPDGLLFVEYMTNEN